MDSTAELAQLQLRFVDQTQWRSEVLRPLVLLADRTAPQRRDLPRPLTILPGWTQR